MKVGHLDPQASRPNPDAAGCSISVIVPVHGSRMVVLEQLESLARQDYQGPWEIVIGDNGVSPDTRARIDSWVNSRTNAHVVDATARRGASHARNVATAAASGELLLYCDADDMVSPWWVSTMARASEQHDFMAGVDDRLIPHDGDSARPWSFARHGDPYPAATETHAFLPWARGGNLGVRRAALLEVGGWDEGWLRGQDVELSWRLQLNGHQLFRVPEARVQYRRPETLWADMMHQFEFGRRAPGLYRAFNRRPSLMRSVRGEFGRVVWLATRSPYLVLSGQRRRTWLLAVSGISGRWVGAWAIWARAALRGSK